MNFRISGLPAEDFAGWFEMSEAELGERHAVRRVVDQEHAFPCRISLTDAQVGEEVLLINHEHLPVDSPYRSRHAIYIRAGERTFDTAGVVPDMLRRRLLSVRAFDERGMMTGCDVVDGRELESAIGELFAGPQAAYLHVHFAKAGCYAARVDRC